MLKIGYMDYINIFPVFINLESYGYDFIKGVPSFLNRSLYAGDVDISPVSSIEYARNPGNYLILPRAGICSSGEVKSVLLCSNYPLTELCGKKIYFTQESLTSANLTKIILEYFLNVQPVYTKDDTFDAELLIGDKALNIYYNQNKKYGHIYDLGTMWKELTGLPFVYSLWLVNKKSSVMNNVKTFYSRLMESIDLISDNISGYADVCVERNERHFTHEQIINYWKTLYYTIGDKEIEGLKLFYKLLGIEIQWNFYEG